jgi:transaldolase
MRKTGLERRRDAGLDLAVPSLASMFISRWGLSRRPLLPPALHGLLGLAMTQKAYSCHLQLLSDKRWQALAEARTRPHDYQREPVISTGRPLPAGHADASR